MSEGRGGEGWGWRGEERRGGAGYAARFSSVSRSLTQPSREPLLHPLLPRADTDAAIHQCLSVCVMFFAFCFFF